MGEWPIVELGSLAANEDGAVAIGPFGSRMKADCYVPDGVPVIRGTNISQGRYWKGDWVYVADDFADSMPNCTTRKGDLVFPHRGAIGEVAIIPGDRSRYMLSTSLMKFRPDNGRAISSFIFYYFRSQAGRSEILKFASQVGTPGIGQPLTSLRKFRVPVPPIRTQSVIADMLSALDDKIELNRQTNETLEALARAIFKDWFVDFGPTRAKAEGRAPYLAPELWGLFPDRLDAEGKPEGWDAGSLMDVADLNPESWTKRNAPRAVEYVDLSNTNWGTIDKTEMHSWASAPSRARRILKPGDTIVGTVRPGNGSYAFIAHDGLTGSTGFAVLRPKSRRDRELVWLAATAPENIERLAFLADGAAYPAVRPDVVANTEIVLADPEAIDAFSGTCGSLLDRIEAHKAESRTLAQTRDLLLPKLMSGKIRLRDAERMVEDAA